MLFTDLSLLHFPDSTRNLFHPYCQAWCRVSPSPDSPFLEGHTATVSSLHYKTGISRDSPKPGCTRNSGNRVQNYLSCQVRSKPQM